MSNVPICSISLRLLLTLESANSSILAPRRLFKEVVGKKNQDFMLIRLFNPNDLIGCGGDINQSKSVPMMSLNVVGEY